MRPLLIKNIVPNGYVVWIQPYKRKKYGIFINNIVTLGLCKYGLILDHERLSNNKLGKQEKK